MIRCKNINRVIAVIVVALFIPLSGSSELAGGIQEPFFYCICGEKINFFVRHSDHIYFSGLTIDRPVQFGKPCVPAKKKERVCLNRIERNIINKKYIEDSDIALLARVLITRFFPLKLEKEKWDTIFYKILTTFYQCEKDSNHDFLKRFFCLRQKNKIHFFCSISKYLVYNGITLQRNQDCGSQIWDCSETIEKIKTNILENKSFQIEDGKKLAQFFLASDLDKSQQQEVSLLLASIMFDDYFKNKKRVESRK